jgi:hypothetical protein
MISCPQCGATLKPGARFCHVCGFKMPEEPQASAKQPPAGEEPPADFKSYTDIDAGAVYSAVKSGSIFSNVFTVMFNPKKGWENINSEKPSIPMLVFAYALLFSAIGFLSIIIGYGLIGIKIPFVRIWYTDIWYGLYKAFNFIISSVGSVIATALIITAMAPTFNTVKNFGRALQLTTLSFMPVWIAAAFFILPMISFMGHLAGFYGVFLVLTGLPVLLKTPKSNQIGYFFTTIGFLYGIYYSFTWVTGFLGSLIFSFGSLSNISIRF